MTEIKPFNYGDVVTTGEAVKTQRLKNMMLAEEMQPDSITNQQRRANLKLTQTNQRAADLQLGEAELLDNSRFALSAFQAMAQDPTTAVQHYPALIERGILPAEADYTQLDPAVIQRDAAAGAQRMEQTLKNYGQAPAREGRPGSIDEFIDAKRLGILRQDMSYEDFKRIGKGPLVQIGADGSMAQQTDSRTTELARESGVPVAPRTPWSNLQDPKEIDKAKVRSFESADKNWREMNDDAKTARQTISDIDRFLFLNQSNYTGAGMMIPGAQTVRKGFDEEFGEMKSLSSKLTPAMRQGLPGAASDRDIAMFGEATIGVEQTPEANENIGLGLKVANQNKADRARFYRAYIDANGHDLYAEQAWDAYLEANPIFDPNAPSGSYKLNPDRKGWQEHFYPDSDGAPGSVDDPLGILGD